MDRLQIQTGMFKALNARSGYANPFSQTALALVDGCRFANGYYVVYMAGHGTKRFTKRSGA
ncbi:hypothetical protein HALA3H3_820001 [Halomonas sp. A3H3]|nr:hypothetical protein HALA3H3_820001 [Halomonas sp. A3H3]